MLPARLGCGPSLQSDSIYQPGDVTSGAHRLRFQLTPVIAVQAEGWPALAPPNMPGPMVGGNSFAGSSSSPQPGTGMVPPTLPANGALPGEAPRYEGQLVSHIMQVLLLISSLAALRALQCQDVMSSQSHACTL